MKRKKNNKVWDALTQKQSEYLIQAGWFEESKYNPTTPIGGIAAVQNYGAVINQNITEKQRAFLHYLGIHLKADTHNLTIVIPPTHFWEACKEKNKAKWKQKWNEAWQSVMLGNIEPDIAMDMLGKMLKDDIKAAIEDISGPPLKQSTIQARLNEKADKKTIGNMDKRLQHTSQMILSASYKVTKQ